MVKPVLIDAVYTPPELAQRLLGYARVRRVMKVADFGAGRGALLAAAVDRWNPDHVVANDLDRGAAHYLRRTRPDWAVSSADFLSQESVRSFRLLRHRGTCDLIVLNPPFSVRGARYEQAYIHGSIVCCSPSMAFVVQGVQFLRPGGEILVLLPDGALDNSRDADARRLLESIGAVAVEEQLGRHSFEGCAQRTAIVRFKLSRVRRHSADALRVERPERSASRTDAVIHRGSIPMHSAVAKGVGAASIVHTTDLHPGFPGTLTAPISSVERSRVTGPAVLVPRVGTPDPRKLCILPAGSTVLLSDCVMAVRVETERDAHHVRSELTNGLWEDFAASYSGSCARFITVERLREVLCRIGIRSTFIGRPAAPSTHRWVPHRLPNR